MKNTFQGQLEHFVNLCQITNLPSARKIAGLVEKICCDVAETNVDT